MSKSPSESDIYLIGKTIDELPVTNLPTNIQVLKLFFYYLEGQHKNNASRSADAVVRKCNEIWNFAGFDTTSISNSKRKILAMHTEFKNINKSKHRTSAAQALRVSDFIKNFDKRFNVGTEEVSKLIKSMSEKKIQLLIQQNRTRVVESSVNQAQHKSKFLSTVCGILNLRFEANEKNFQETQKVN